jgi:hypothetical protein
MQRRWRLFATRSPRRACGDGRTLSFGGASSSILFDPAVVGYINATVVLGQAIGIFTVLAYKSHRPGSDPAS